MTRYALPVVIAALVVGGCKGQEDTAPEAGRPPRPDSTGVAPGRVRVLDAPATGDVREAVRQALSRASGEKRKVVVYVGATWCEPCQRFHQAAANGELDAIFPDLTLLEFDLDRDRERLGAAGYSSKYIPLFALPGPDGSASGKQVEGGIKGEAAVAYMAPRLKALLGQ
ncbi:MAG: thioredoxin family protein [Polyangiaceae bacterium]